MLIKKTRPSNNQEDQTECQPIKPDLVWPSVNQEDQTQS